MTQRPLPRLLSYGAAILITCGAVLLRESLTPVWEMKVPFIFLFPAVMLSAWLGGIGPGLLTLGLCALAADYLWLPPRFSLAIREPSDLIAFLVAIGVMFAIACLTAALRRMNDALHQELATRQQIERERQQLLTQVEAERDKLQTLINTLTDEVWTCDAEGIITLLSAPTALGLGARSAEDLLPRTRDWLAELAIYTANGCPRRREHAPLLRALQGETIRDAEEMIRHPATGELLYRLVSAAPLRDQTGQITGAIAAVHDITERKRLEDALQQREREFSTVVENLPDVIFRLDPQLRPLFISNIVEQFTGLPPRALLGKTGREMGLPTEACDQFEAACQTVLETGRSHTLEFVYHARCFRCRLIPERTAHGEIATILGITEEITEQRRTEVALRESEARYRLLAEHARDVITRHALDGTFLYVSPAIQSFLGYTPEELVQQSALDLFHPEDIDAIKQHIAQAVARREGVTYTYRVRHKDGRYLWGETNSQPVPDPITGEIREIVAVARDITDRKEIELQLQRQAAELQRSNAELQQFAYVASHDLQEPLRMVTSYVQLLAKRYQAVFDATAQEYIKFAVEGAQRMKTLIEDLLAYSRVGTQSKPFAPVACEQVLTTTLQTLQIAIAESRAQITHDPLPVVQGEATQLGLLFQNLLSNALKFRDARPPRIHIAAQRTGQDWQFAVQDNGIGLDPQHAEQIFVIFQRLHTRAEYPGTGMGLAICKKIVERHGGRIWVEAQPSQGATFYFTIPLSFVNA